MELNSPIRELKGIGEKNRKTVSKDRSIHLA